MNKSKNKIEWSGVIIIMLILTLVFWGLFSGYQDCAYENGVYVRSLFWFTCIK